MCVELIKKKLCLFRDPAVKDVENSVCANGTVQERTVFNFQFKWTNVSRNLRTPRLVMSVSYYNGIHS